MAQIIENKLYLGDIYDANNDQFLKNRAITAVICVAQDGIVCLPNLPSIKIYNFNIQDNISYNISAYFDEIGEIIDKENIVLVNCICGISRSATIVTAYLMKYCALSLKNALMGTYAVRPIICPNDSF